MPDVEPAVCEDVAFESQCQFKIYLCPVDPDRATFKILVAGHSEYDGEWLISGASHAAIAAECGEQVEAHVKTYLDSYATG